MEKNKKRIIFTLFIVIASLLSVSAALGSETVAGLGNSVKGSPGDKKSIPIINLPMPGSEQGKGYLGLTGTGNFPIGQIKTQVLIIEFFSFYCPHCQVMASQVNELYQKIQERPGMKDKIKMIGIGASNTDHEVDLFKERYRVPFPLFPDQSLELTKMLGVRGTPTFIGIKVNDDGTQERFYLHEGGFEDNEQVLSEIIKLSGLK